jgi:hypothetical protein
VKDLPNVGISISTLVFLIVALLVDLDFGRADVHPLRSALPSAPIVEQAIEAQTVPTIRQVALTRLDAQERVHESPPYVSQPFSTLQSQVRGGSLEARWRAVERDIEIDFWQVVEQRVRTAHLLQLCFS